MIKKTIILLTMTFALTLSLYATDSKIDELDKESSIDKIETALVLDGEPCGEVCGDFCPRFFPNQNPCGYTYCDSGNGGGTYLCMGGEYPDSPTPPDNTKVGTINP